MARYGVASLIIPAKNGGGKVHRFYYLKDIEALIALRDEQAKLVAPITKTTLPRKTEVKVEVKVESIPPIGLRARRFYVSERVSEIGQAIHRYTEAHHPVPIEWITEYNELLAADKKVA